MKQNFIIKFNNLTILHLNVLGYYAVPLIGSRIMAVISNRIGKVPLTANRIEQYAIYIIDRDTALLRRL